MFHLALALFWLIAGAAMIFWQRTHPESATFTIGGSRVSFGWFAFVLVLYNLARWWSIRLAAKQRGALAEREQRGRSQGRAPQEHESRPNADFDFTESKPPG